MIRSGSWQPARASQACAQPSMKTLHYSLGWRILSVYSQKRMVGKSNPEVMGPDPGPRCQQGTLRRNPSPPGLRVHVQGGDTGSTCKAGNHRVLGTSHPMPKDRQALGQGCPAVPLRGEAEQPPACLSLTWAQELFPLPCAPRRSWTRRDRTGVFPRVQVPQLVPDSPGSAGRGVGFTRSSQERPGTLKMGNTRILHWKITGQ